MTIRECYDIIGADFDGVKGRLLSEERVQKFTLRFLDDDTFATLEKAYAAQDWQTAFRAAHTLKGASANLGFTALSVSSSALTETLRSGSPTAETPALYEKTTADYKALVAGIESFKASL